MSIKKFNEFGEINENENEPFDISGFEGKSGEKLFMCFWNAEAFDLSDDNQVTMKGLDNFTEGNGYDEKDISDINSLEIGQSWNSPKYHNDHIITRIK